MLTNYQSKTAQLEERLNSLVDLLKATNSGELPASLRDPPSVSDDSTVREYTGSHLVKIDHISPHSRCYWLTLLHAVYTFRNRPSRS